MPSVRPTKPSPSPRFGVIDTCTPGPIGRRTGSSAGDEVGCIIASRCGASRGASAATTTSTLTTHHRSRVDPARDVAQQLDRRDRRGTARRTPGTAARGRGARPGRAASRRPRARSTSASEWPTSPGPSSVTPPSTSGPSPPNGWTSKPSPTRITSRSARPAARRRARRSSGPVTFTLAGSPATTTTVPTVALRRARRRRCRRRRPACAARSARPRNACGVCTATRSLAVDRLDHPLAVDPLDRVGDRQSRDRAVGAGRTASITAVKSASLASGRAASCTTTISRVRRAPRRDPARTDAARVAPPATAAATGGPVPVGARPAARRRHRRSTGSRCAPRGRPGARRRRSGTASPRRSARPSRPRRRSSRSAPVNTGPASGASASSRRPGSGSARTPRDRSAGRTPCGPRSSARSTTRRATRARPRPGPRRR